MESQYAINNNKLTSLSEQNIIDCSWNYGNNGCSGGLMGNVFEYVKVNNGIDTEEMYPYEGEVFFLIKSKDETCRYKRNPFTLTGQGMVDSENETALMVAVATIGPISVGINANSDFMQYESGMFSEKVIFRNFH
ncbi:cathepsin L1-like [Octopus sinensis]|uniref:Cathepsin L1-like n=1 Tax=Octopus sinensis TaxID=2607531 RepID=A0A7E6EGX2_9MOLL|nr:cathepsin L1-like [Octopus sinensis]